MDIILSTYESSCGLLILGSLDNSLCLCDWAHSRLHERNKRRLRQHFKADFVEGNSATIDIAKQELDEYFKGMRTVFSFPLLLSGTDFQRQVMQALQALPYGATCSYADVARSIGRPAAVRAVAQAIGSNPISVIIPCHRVIGSTGTLTGYAGGLAAKDQLLQIEQKLKNRQAGFLPA